MTDLHPDIVDLLVQRATEGISDEQAHELETLLREHGLEDTLELDLAAAAAANAFALRDVREFEAAPGGLKDKLRADADRHFDERRDKLVPLSRRDNNGVANFNWGWATAAMLAIALLFTNIADLQPSQSLEEARAALASAPGTTIIQWSEPDIDDYAGVSGDVVWNDELQRGYMLLSNMPANDPGNSQYQLWVVDPDRDRNPVDGGVFDIPAGRDTVIVPINVKLAVNDPAAFAITREKPGGVVVSEGPLLLVASAG